MHRIALALCLVTMGCASSEVWYREGAPAAKLNDDYLQCRVDAVQSVPVSTRVARTPLRMTPLRTICRDDDGKTRCTTMGGYVYGGETYTYDANAGLRREVVDRCMTRLGYRQVSLPACSAEVARTAPRRFDRVPPLGEKSCTLPAEGGRMAIYTPQ